MWAPLLLLFFLRSAESTNQDFDPLTQIAQAFFNEDFFLTRLKSASINPCANFYRRLCPRDFPDKLWIWNKIIEAHRNIFEHNQIAEWDSAYLSSFDRIDTLRETLLRNRTIFHAEAFAKKVAAKYVQFVKIVKNFEDVVETDRTILKLVQREGMDHASARQRVESLITNIIDEYLSAIKVAFANRYSIPDHDKDTIAEKFRKSFLEQYRLLSEMARMPMLHIFCAKLIAGDFILREYPGYALIITVSAKILLKLLRTKSREPEAFASEADRDLSPTILMILILFSIHAAFSAKTASLRACSSHFTAIEDTADVYGVQIVFNVMRKMLGTEIVKIVFPELAMTHRELFYHTLAAGLCTSDFASVFSMLNGDSTLTRSETTIRTMDRVNGMLGQLPDFKQTFGCYDDDLMVFPEKSMCPVFSEGFARRR